MDEATERIRLKRIDLEKLRHKAYTGSIALERSTSNNSATPKTTAASEQKSRNMFNSTASATFHKNTL